MENSRLILFVALSVVVLLLWQAWEQDYGRLSKKTATPASAQQAPATSAKSADVPAVPATGAEVPAVAAAIQSAPHERKLVHIVTDVMDLDIDTQGGTLNRVDLLKYPVKADEPSQPFRLMQESESNTFIAQSGLLSSREAPDHHAVYGAEQGEYRLANNANELKVRLNWTGSTGVTVTKVYTFTRGSYVVGVEYQINNTSATDWQARAYHQLQRSRQERESALIYTYTGGVLYSAENKYEKISFDNMDKETLSRDTKGGWAAMIQHYFVGAWLPDASQLNHYYSKALDKKNYVIGMVTPEFAVPAGKSMNVNGRLYVGPKEQDVLKDIAPGLELTVDYGWLTFLAKPLFWLLKHIEMLVHNWGWAIILLTLLIKLAFYKLSETSYKSMANMRKVAPKLTALRERYGDDRQRMSQAMMELYKKEKINPLGGCLPILVQIPVFIALYWVLLESVEMRQADFMLWLNDLSSKDPYYVLPLIMGATMFIQQKLNPPPPDPIQAKVMMALPFIFTLFFAFFPAGLVLYWVANNFLSISQQWYITRKIEKAAA